MTASLGHVLSQLQRWTSPRLQELSDAVLLERFVQQRDESALAALVSRPNNGLCHLIVWMMKAIDTNLSSGVMEGSSQKLLELMR